MKFVITKWVCAVGLIAQQSPLIPKVWVDAEIAKFEVPLADPAGSPKHVSAEYYYRIPVRKIYKSYPVYLPSKEPAGYLDKLKQVEPKLVFDPARLKTKEDWLRAGQVAFDAPIQIQPLPDDPAAIGGLRQMMAGLAASKEGIIPTARWVIEEKGKLSIGNHACSMCHSRVMPDGSVIVGAQGNVPFDAMFGASMRGGPAEPIRRSLISLFGAPWMGDRGPQARIEKMSPDELGEAHMGIPPGVIARHRSSTFHPVQVPDLIGVEKRKYLDRTGLQQHRFIVDLMRYGAMNQGADNLASFGGFVPGAEDFKTLPEPGQLSRYSDEQLYALSLYIYSLQPPVNPNGATALTMRGKQVFNREGCAGCHAPPLYTNNKLSPVPGFTVPEEHRKLYDVMAVSVGTDPGLAIETRRGTGYYKVPSLLGVWYRGPFEHSGSVATLEDWFDPARLKDDYVPTGFKGYGVKTRAVKGHEFGLKLTSEDKQALIAFLKTL